MNFYNEEDVAEQRAAQQKEKTGRELELDDLRKVLSTKEGRRLIFRYMEDNCGLMKISAHASGSQTYTNEGRRAIALEILEEINELDVRLYAQMTIEMKG